MRDSPTLLVSINIARLCCPSINLCEHFSIISRQKPLALVSNPFALSYDYYHFNLTAFWVVVQELAFLNRFGFKPKARVQGSYS